MVDPPPNLSALASMEAVAEISSPQIQPTLQQNLDKASWKDVVQSNSVARYDFTRPTNNLEPKPQSSSPQTKVSSNRSDTEQPIIQQHEASEQSNLTQSMVVETGPTINLAKEVGTPQAVQDLETVIDTSKTGEEENWQTVSPGKIGRKETTDQISPVGISPSIFSVLEDQEEMNECKDKEDDDQLEEGEVVIQYKEEDKASSSSDRNKCKRYPP
ncbi:unnamed protein product [Arabis nemorensis]|uniref:Uncharacterized protein n=1 Tax=Arabis nemorensis TaxID=586526 RepID=A0A565CEL6_9BRAS|nr:unnamed protein product [Arabis nemorensis]